MLNTSGLYVGLALFISGLLYFIGFMFRGPSVSPFDAERFEVWIHALHFREGWLFLIGGSIFEMLSLAALFYYLRTEVHPVLLITIILITFCGKAFSMLLQGQAVLSPASFPDVIKSASQHLSMKIVFAFAFLWMIGSVLVALLWLYASPALWWVIVPYCVHVILLNQGARSFILEFCGALVLLYAGVAMLILNYLTNKL